ncbi:hypothetical protein CDL12_21530 [Handroanthus impetiginosus]|uniref:BSD domain-containing protein n=1 Tax=Handroanthus impetiginosus TaxID=429701 RepID=A0A2G9GKU5_9LAMI|nr:hypothetical protein CDL12_21530 [Handroanthus impetiginosus]
MSSWIPSLFNPFSDDDDPSSPAPSSPSKATPKSPSSGAKDDLSAVFRGVAAFLAPPQTASASGPSSSSESIEGIKHDLAEIQGSFRSGLSLLSSKLTSNFLQLKSQLNDGDENYEVEEEEEEEEEEYAVGIDEEILDFVRKISGRPELWTDFPLSLPDDFDLSDYQKEHAANIDHLVPEFVTLRQKIGSQISNGKFWLIYFILLLPRLNEEDMKLLSSPQVAEAREKLLNQLQNKTDGDKKTSGDTGSSDVTKESSESATQQRNVSPETGNPTKQRDIVNESKSAHLSEEVDQSHTSTDSQKQSENEDDVSFSDLEDDDNDLDKQSGPKVSRSEKTWVQLNENSASKDAKRNTQQSASRDKESEGEESSDWLTVDDTDFDNLAAI